MSERQLSIMYDVNNDSREVLTESSYLRREPLTITVADTGKRSVKQSAPNQKYVINAHGYYDITRDGHVYKTLPYNCLIYHYSKYGEYLYCGNGDDINICNNYINPSHEQQSIIRKGQQYQPLLIFVRNEPNDTFKTLIDCTTGKSIFNINTYLDKKRLSGEYLENILKNIIEPYHTKTYGNIIYELHILSCRGMSFTVENDLYRPQLNQGYYSKYLKYKKKYLDLSKYIKRNMSNNMMGGSISDQMNKYFTAGK